MKGDGMTVRNVNKALAAAGYPDFRLVRGKGYYYFVGGPN